MTNKRRILSGAVLAFSLCFAITTVATVALDRVRRDSSTEPFDFAKSEFQRDEQQFLADHSSLRRSLLKESAGDQIALLRQQVRQDWFQVVSDRGYPHRDQENLSPELAVRRHGVRGRRG